MFLPLLLRIWRRLPGPLRWFYLRARYGRYADEVLARQMDPKVLAEVRALEAKKDFENPRYMELLIPSFYHQHLCRLQDPPGPG